MKNSVRLFAVLTIILSSSILLAWPPGGNGGGGGGNGGGGNGGGSKDAPAPAYPIDYQITYLGTLGGNRSDAFGINNYGDVVGSSETDVIAGRSWRHAYLNYGLLTRICG